MKTILLLLVLMGIGSEARAALPSVWRFESTWFEGHSAPKDESARGCRLDVIHLRVTEDLWAMLMLWSDSWSALRFTAFVPPQLFPLQDGATWQDQNGQNYFYKDGLLVMNGGEFQAKIRPDFSLVETASGKSEGSFLRCEF